MSDVPFDLASVLHIGHITMQFNIYLQFDYAKSRIRVLPVLHPVLSSTLLQNQLGQSTLSLAATCARTVLPSKVVIVESHEAHRFHSHVHALVQLQIIVYIIWSVHMEFDFLRGATPPLARSAVRSGTKGIHTIFNAPIYVRRECIHIPVVAT